MSWSSHKIVAHGATVVGRGLALHSIEAGPAQHGKHWAGLGHVNVWACSGSSCCWCYLFSMRSAMQQPSWAAIAGGVQGTAMRLPPGSCLAPLGATQLWPALVLPAALCTSTVAPGETTPAEALDQCRTCCDVCCYRCLQAGLHWLQVVAPLCWPMAVTVKPEARLILAAGMAALMRWWTMLLVACPARRW